jgi:hypothetical protein
MSDEQKPDDDKVPYRLTIELATDAENGGGRTIQLMGMTDRLGDPVNNDRDLTRMAAAALEYQAKLMRQAIAETEAMDAAEKAEAFDKAADLFNMPTSRMVN